MIWISLDWQRTESEGTGWRWFPKVTRVLGDLTVLDNLRAAASFMSLRDSIANIDRALALFPELSARLDVPASALSGGQKQMVLIGQAIIANPQFLLIDELSLGLAPTIVNRLANTLQQLAVDGAGVVLIEQFTTLALSLSWIVKDSKRYRWLERLLESFQNVAEIVVKSVNLN